MHAPSPGPRDSTSRVGVFDRWVRRMVLGRFRDLRHGQLTVIDPSGTTAWGEPGDLHAILRVRRPGFFRQALLGGTLGVAESYLRGDWDCDDLTSFFRIFARNQAPTTRIDRGMTKLTHWLHRAYHRWRDNSRDGSRRNIEAHYDLGNEFYALWLDETLAYSSGIFRSPTAGLCEASVEKFDRICRKLDLRTTDHVLEIGGGWGGFALHAAEHFGCRVTTTTISQKQFELAARRIHQRGLQHRISLLQQDYRDLDGKFDKLVSIEMIEAVGFRHLDRYFAQCGRLLRPDGSLVLQAIVMPERGYGEYLRSVDFIQRYVFPGGCLPSVGAILDSVARTTDLRLVHVEEMAPHYAETLRRWRSAFRERLADVPRLGYSERFIRLWNYYLCYCEAAFEERSVGVVQLQFDKPQCRRDPIRITDWAAAPPRHEWAAARALADEELCSAVDRS